MTEQTVEVRAEQRFENWAYGEVRTVPRTARVEALIANGRLSMITPDPAPAAASTPTEETEQPAPVDPPPRQPRRTTKE